MSDDAICTHCNEQPILVWSSKGGGACHDCAHLCERCDENPRAPEDEACPSCLKEQKEGRPA